MASHDGLGEVVGVRQERSTGSMASAGLAVSAVGLLLTVLLGAVNSARDTAAYSAGGGTVQHFLAPTGAITVIGLGMALRGVVIGTGAHFLYDGGLVYRSRSGSRVEPWAAIRALNAVHGREAGAVVGYRVESATDHSTVIPLRLSGGRDDFVDRLLALAQQHHVTID